MVIHAQRNQSHHEGSNTAGHEHEGIMGGGGVAEKGDESQTDRQERYRRPQPTMDRRHRNSRGGVCMGNVDRCCTRLRANANFLSPASLLIEFMRSLLRNGSAQTSARNVKNLESVHSLVIWSSMPACRRLSRSPITRSARQPAAPKQGLQEHVLACAVSAMMGIGSRPCVCSYVRMSSVASIPPMNGIGTSICAAKQADVTSISHTPHTRARGSRLTRMTSNGLLRCTRVLNASTASWPFSAIST